MFAKSGWTDLFVRPGDSGTVDWSVQNDPQSVDDAQAVKVVVDAPNFFQVQGNSDLGPATINRGASKTFHINYQVSPGFQSGSISVSFALSLTNVIVRPPVDSLVSQLTIAIDNTPPTQTILDDQRRSFQPNTQGIYVTAQDDGSGMDWVEVNNPWGTTLAIDDAPQPGQRIFSTRFFKLPDGDYVVSSYDLAGNRADTSITICTNPNGCTASPNPCPGMTPSQCQQTCQANPQSCTTYCQQNPTSLACQTGCTINPNACVLYCAQYPNLCSICSTQPENCQAVCVQYPPLCQTACQQNPPLCQPSCQQNPALPWCPCVINPSAPGCEGGGPPPGGVRSPPSAGFGQIDSQCNRYAIYQLSLTGDPGDSMNVAGLGGLSVGGPGRQIVTSRGAINAPNSGSAR